MANPQQILIPVTESSQIAEARRVALAMALEIGLGETDCGRVGIVATELATNLVRHAQAGELILRPLWAAPATTPGLEILSLDHGPGISDPARCLADGYSSRGTSGNGLGAVWRFSQQFEMASTPDAGTVVLSRVYATGASGAPAAPGAPERSPTPEAGVVCLPLRGEIACGDAWGAAERNDAVSLMVVDGLGHGLLAAVAAEAAWRVFHADPFRPPAVLLEAAHAALQGTRGAAALFAAWDRRAQTLKFAGAGNITGCAVAEGGQRNLLSQNGIVGYGKIKIVEAELPLPPGSRLMLHSDGISGRWRGGLRQEFWAGHPAVIAAGLFRDFRLPHDDATVMVVG